MGYFRFIFIFASFNKYTCSCSTALMKDFILLFSLGNKTDSVGITELVWKKFLVEVRLRFKLGLDRDEMSSRGVFATGVRSSYQECSTKKLFLKMLQYLQENTCVGVFFK